VTKDVFSFGPLMPYLSYLVQEQVIENDLPKPHRPPSRCASYASTNCIRITPLALGLAATVNFVWTASSVGVKKATLGGLRQRLFFCRRFRI
jgi:hypothetical protein